MYKDNKIVSIQSEILLIAQLILLLILAPAYWSVLLEINIAVLVLSIFIDIIAFLSESRRLLIISLLLFTVSITLYVITYIPVG